jgi:FkbM family methyltransferase
MDIEDENGKKIDVKKVETVEQHLANKFIKEDDIVLELGARYGSVSCVINSKLNNKMNQVVVEPDKRVWLALDKNRQKNECNFHIVNGFISKRKLDLKNLNCCRGGYGSTFFDTNETEIPSYTLDEIKTKYGLKFNVLVADCEGFLERFFDENPECYDELRMIIFEKDYPNKCNYDKIKKELVKKGFKKVDLFKKVDKQNVFIKL